MSAEEDPKVVAAKERKTPEVERLLRQFVNTDGPKGNSKAYQEGWDRIFGKKTEPKACRKCGFLLPDDEQKDEGEVDCDKCWADYGGHGR